MFKLTNETQIEAGKPWRIQVKGVRLKVPENAKCSIEHERFSG